MNLKYMSIIMILTLGFLGVNGCAVNLNSNKYSLNDLCTRHPYCSSRSCFTLLVSELTAQPGYETDQMIYAQCPYQLKAYSRNRWVAPPHEMLASLLSQSLRNTCFFKAVVTSPFAGRSQYRLDTKLIKLQQEFFCCPSRVRMVVHVVLIDSCCNEALAEKMLEVVVLAPKNNPYSGVIAANKATRLILEQIAHFATCTISQHSLPTPKKYFLPFSNFTFRTKSKR